MIITSHTRTQDSDQSVKSLLYASAIKEDWCSQVYLNCLRERYQWTVESRKSEWHPLRGEPDHAELMGTTKC